jgi:cell fate regulator YaaT (PSP1 superfamily)
MEMPEYEESPAESSQESFWVVEFKGNRRGHFSDPNNLEFGVGDFVIVQVERGEDIGRVKRRADFKEISSLGEKVYAILRVANKDDLDRMMVNRRMEQESYKSCQTLIEKHDLKMKLADVAYQFDCNKIIFYFTADKRVDFRELVKDLANTYKTRIELRQIGVRDEAKRLGGFGSCGLPLCCVSFLREFNPISTQMAKDQNLSLNPSKISGNCGRLLCCLSYEKEVYAQALPEYPQLGSTYQTKRGPGVVEKINIFKEYIVVSLEDGTEQKVSLAEIKGKKKRGFGIFKPRHKTIGEDGRSAP